jgi:hypothetical protein
VSRHIVSKKKIANQLEDALYGRKPLSLDVYVEVLPIHETKLKESLDNDADDALLCMIADERDVAMLVIDWDGSVYRNENGLKKLWEMWGVSFDQNMTIFTAELIDVYGTGKYALFFVAYRQ